MPIVDLYGHDSLRARLRASVGRGTLPASLLIHGPRGVGKQRLALWLGQLLLCESPGTDGPCGACRSCRYAKELGHPDLHWYFPRPRPKDADPSLDEVKNDFIDAIHERLDTNGIYAPPSGLEGIFIRTVHLVVQQAGMTPTLGSRKVFVIGDADRMIAQEGSDQAANAFLKLLEEPLPDTTVVLTTSEPATLLPTIRSRVIGLRANPLPESDLRAFLKDPLVTAALQSYRVPKSPEEQVRLANGAPGALLNAGTTAEAHAFANEMLGASRAGDAERFRLGLAFGSSRARGFFSDVLDALTALLHGRARERAASGDEDGARRAAVAVRAVEKAKFRASGNVNPQLIGSALLRELAELRP